METQKDRILAFIVAAGMSVREFERLIGVSNGTIRHQSDNLSANVRDKISAKFPQMNVDWLLFGNGNMINDSSSSVEQHAEHATAPVYQNNGNGGNNVTQNNVNGELLTIIHKRDEQIDRLLTIIENMKPKATN
jgi:hypothetical protein